jgi:hypothetical protein
MYDKNYNNGLTYIMDVTSVDFSKLDKIGIRMVKIIL